MMLNCFIVFAVSFQICSGFNLHSLIRERRAAKPEDVKLYLFNNNVKNESLNDKPNDYLDTSKPTVFIAHGYTQNPQQPYFSSMTEAFLKNNDEYNIIHVDWEKPARQFYITSAKNTKLVGNILADFIVSRNLDLKKLHLVGHSLGAHLAGFAGKKLQELTGKKAGRITGIDPAGPYFVSDSITSSDRLSNEDAEIVIIIHTDYTLFGYKNPLGTFDIYANGGDGKQPFCIKEYENRAGSMEASICHHMVACDYFAEFVNSKFDCKMCNSIEDYESGSCSGNNLQVSYNDINEQVTGLCFAKTNEERPFL